MLDNFTLIDLTHTITTSIPSWQGTSSFSFTIIKDYHQGVRTQQFQLSSNSGTHMDAPGHLKKSAQMIDQIPLSHLFVPVYVIDVSAHTSEDYIVPLQVVTDYEKQHGQIPPNCLVVIHTGWCNRWNEPRSYINLDTQGKMHFPGISQEVGQYLVDRKIIGFAIDTFSPDGADEHFPVHKIFLEHNIYIIENITNTDKLPPTGAFVAALPLKIYDAVEAPMRIIGLVPH